MLGNWLIARSRPCVPNTPHARFLWGFSNTTFFDSAIRELPPGIDGQSYHPYGTGTRKLPEQETHEDHPEFNLDGYTRGSKSACPKAGRTRSSRPSADAAAESSAPRGSSRGMSDSAISSPSTGCARRVRRHRRGRRPGPRRLSAPTRSYCMWLNKGIATLHYFNAYDAKPLKLGLLPANLAQLPPPARFEDVATPPMRDSQPGAGVRWLHRG